MSIEEVFAGLPVEDLHASVEWYGRLLGREPDFYPNDNEAVWDLGGRGWIYVVVDPERAGRSLLTVLVDDLEEQIEAISGRGLDMGEIDEVPGAVRKSAIEDPDGNRVTFGQPLQ
jgi:predicted enzyme related to lactoylglutathione lyase